MIEQFIRDIMEAPDDHAPRLILADWLEEHHQKRWWDVALLREWPNMQTVLKPIDEEIFQKGRSIFMTHTTPGWRVEQWVRLVRVLSGQKVDWSFSAGRSIVRCRGDTERVVNAIRFLLPLLRQFYDEEEENSSLPTPVRNPWKFLGDFDDLESDNEIPVG